MSSPFSCGPAWWVGTALALAAATAVAQPLKLHVPSPDWRDQVVYFVMTDRFDDGDPANNDQGAGEYDPKSNAHYNGGDFAGLRRRLDYIAGLGATTLWITPPVAQLWWDGSAKYGGYHGYWASNFLQVDPHLGSLDDYKALSGDLHGRGMYLMQDIVLNHTGNFFRYPRGDWRASDPARGWQANLQARPVTAPTQPPFDQNDPRNPAHRAAGIYHWTPEISDFKNPQQLLNWQLSELDDLNTENPAVRRALRQSYGHWLREVGVDAFRVDTAFYVPPALFTDFLHSTDPAAPGISQVARATGRRDFYSVGEGFVTDAPFATTALRRIERYVRGPKREPLLPGMLNFTLYGSLGDVLARGAPTAVLGHRITSMMRLHSDPHRLATFVDNHDVDRFLAGGSEAGLRQALLAIMTLPGIPVIYYGTEQGFTAQRAAMFAAGVDSGGRDRFDTTHPLYQTIAKLTALRREHRLFSRGVPTVLQASAIGPGVIAWRMQHGRDAALVVLNTADSPTLLHDLPTGLAAGTALQPLLALDGQPATLRTGAGGRLTAELPARSGQVWRLPVDAPADAAAANRHAASPLAAAPLAVTQARPSRDGNQLQASGRAPAGSRLRLVADGDLAGATTVQADAQGRWQATLDTARLRAGVTHQLVAWQAGDGDAGGLASAPRPFRLQRAWTLLADQADPVDDDRGPEGAAGTYVYPTDASWRGHGQMDLRRAQVWRSGAALKIRLTLAQLVREWGAPNGFDHLALTLFFSQPGRPEGATVMPQQQASLPAGPDGQRWQHRLRVGGWSNAFYSAAGADAANEGTPLSPAAEVEADRARRTITLTLPAGSLGPAEALAGLRIHVTTWDHDGGYRALGPQPGGHTVGGADPAGPKVMDAMTITLP